MVSTPNSSAAQGNPSGSISCELELHHPAPKVPEATGASSVSDVAVARASAAALGDRGDGGEGGSVSSPREMKPKKTSR